MKLFSSDGSFAMVSVGAAPIGIFAIGQFARGFIAVGQLAIGFIVLGQGCVSVIGLGQGGIGVMWFAGMFGIGGRGLCFRCIPGMDPPRTPPEEISFQSLIQGLVTHEAGASEGRAGVSEGFVRAQILSTPNGLCLAQGNQPLPIKITPSVAMGLFNADNVGHFTEIYAHLKLVGRTIVCDRLIEIPGMRREYSAAFQALRVSGLIVIAAIFWWSFLILDTNHFP